MSTHDLAAHAHDGCLRCVESMSKRTRLKHAFRQQMDGRADVVSRVGWGRYVVWVGVWLGGLFWVGGGVWGWWCAGSLSVVVVGGGGLNDFAPSP